jgi:hypothetical protein
MAKIAGKTGARDLGLNICSKFIVRVLTTTVIILQQFYY